MTKLNLSVDEINEMYDNEMKVLKAIDDDERKIEAKAITYLSTGEGFRRKIGKQISEIIKRYEEERPKCEALPHCSRLITDSIDDEIKRLDELFNKLYEKRRRA